MKIFLFLFLMMLTGNAYAESLILCYLHRTVIISADKSFEDPVIESYMLFRKDFFNEQRNVTVDGVEFQLEARSFHGLRGESSPPVVITQFKIGEEWFKMGLISSMDLYDRSRAETDHYEPPISEGSLAKRIQIKTICESISEKNATVKLFNEIIVRMNKNK